MLDTRNQVQNLIIIIFFSITLAPYLSDYIPKPAVQLIMFAVGYSLFAYFASNASLLHIKSIKNQLFWCLLFLYELFLGIRLYVDFIIKDIDFFAFGSGYTIIFFYFMQIIIPSMLFFRYKLVPNIHKISIYIVVILSICMILSINKIMHGEVELSPDGRFDNGYGIFSIEFGHYAATLILTCVLLLKSKIKIFIKPFLVLSIFLGSIAAILSGSRGPILAIILCLGVYFISNTKNTSKIIKYIIIVIIISPILLFWAEEITEFFSSMGIRSAERIYDSFLGDDSITKHTSGRDTLYNDALFYFSESPLFGYSYLIPGKIYCHNIILEQFMALGIVGGLIFFIINIIGLKAAWNILKKRREYALIPILYIQYFIFGCFSITIISLPQYWLFLLLTMNYSSNVYSYKSDSKQNYQSNIALLR